MQLARSGTVPDAVCRAQTACAAALPQRASQGRLQSLPQRLARRRQRQSPCRAAERPLPGREAGGAQAADSISDDLAQYAQLKEDISRTSRRFAFILSGYLALTSTFDVAGLVLLGSLAGYGYLQLLMRDVDAFREDDPVAAAFLMQEDSKLELAALRSVKKVGAAYRAALRPRLLVLVGLAAAVAAFDAVSPEPLNLGQTACVFGGFFTYKAGLVGQVWDATRPRFNSEDLLRPPRPALASTEDEEAEEADAEEWRRRLKQL